jgi:hypothetical protein
MEIGIRLDCQVIHGQVRRLESERRPKISVQLRQRLIRQSIHQVEIEVFEMRSRDVDRCTRLSLVVNTPQFLKMPRIEALDADRQAIHARRSILRELFAFKRAGIRFKRDFGIGCECHARAHR